MEEAKKAVQKLTPVPISSAQYKSSYKQDSQLLSKPDRKYKGSWVDWYDFLGIQNPKSIIPYATIEEAKEAVQNLKKKPTGYEQYKKLYKQDSKLPSAPEKLYQSSWINWYDFLGKEPINCENYYTTIEEAKIAVQQLTPVPTTVDKYKEAFTKNNKLPKFPDVFYKIEWVDWYDYLGTKSPYLYKTLGEARVAVQMLNPVPTTNKQYQNIREQDSKLPSVPEKKYKGEWIDWYDLLGTKRPEFYRTLEEAKAAVQLLTPVPRTVDLYRKTSINDCKLPADPDQFYKATWESWYDFLETNKKGEQLYQTLEEAKIAMKKLIPTPQTKKQYHDAQKQDNRLPFHPNTFYKDWVDWPDFFEQEIYSYKELVAFCAENNIKKSSELAKKTTKNKSIPSAKNRDKLEGYYDFPSLVGIEYVNPLDAIKLIQILAPTLSSTEEYQALRKWYRSLPEDPVIKYGFSTFEEFLAFNHSQIFNKEEATAFCQNNKINSAEEYKSFALKTPKLPILVKDIKGVTKLAQIRFTDSPFNVFDSQEYDDWINIAEKYCSKGRNPKGRENLIKVFYRQYKNILHNKIERQCLTSTELINPTDWFNSLPESSRNESSLNHLKKFFDFILEKRCSDVDEETGEVILLEGYRIPIRFSNLPVEFVNNSRSETDKDALPFKYIQKARNFIAPEQVKTLGGIYEHITDQTDLFTNYDSWFDIDESLIDEEDNNCIWRIHPTNKKYQLWSPVRLVAALLQLYVPLRGAQVVWLDSGEADQYKLIQNEQGELIWLENTLFSKYRVPVNNYQGFLKPESFGNERSIIHTHINTNKTGRDAHKGYGVPWVDERVLPFLIELIEWQGKYNPISEPTRWEDAELRKDTAKSELYKYGYKGTSCFLFRDPCNGDGKSPLNQTKLGSTLAGVLHMIEDSELPLTKLGNEDSHSLSNIISYYTLHSMRVSLITAYIRDAKIAPEIVQKIVGHSSIVMTIYYTKVRVEEIRDELKYAENRIIQNQTERVEQLIRQGKLDKLMSELISIDGKIKKSSLPKNRASYAIMDYGICPNGRTKCDMGSSEKHKKTNHYLPVEAGYLGIENCPRCRFLLTGPAFIGGLQLLVNEISLECNSSSLRIAKFGDEIDLLEKEKFTAKKLGHPFDKQHQLNTAESNYQQEVTYFDNFNVDMISLIRLSFSAIELINRREPNTSDKSLLLITQLDEEELKIQLSETSDYLHLDIICQSAVYYQSSRPEKANINRSQLIDMFATKNGLMPGMFALTPEKQIEVGNEVTNMLLARLGSYEKLSDAMDKQSLITLEDLGIEKPTETKKELKLLLAGNTLKLTHSNDSKKGAKKDEL